MTNETGAAAALTRPARPWRDGAAALAVAAAYAVLSWQCGAARHAFELDPDEGGNAMKALLLARGDALYASIWSDQPPLFSVALRAWFTRFGFDVEVGRALVLLAAALLIAIVYDLTRRAGGHRAALLAVGLLCGTAYFRTLSVALMIGLPSVTLALAASWALLAWQRSGRLALWLTAGVLMGASLAVKLFTAFLVPLCALWIVLLPDRRRRRLALAGGWLLIVAAAWAVMVLPWTGGSGIDPLLRSHLAARQALRAPHAHDLLWRGLLHDGAFLVLAGGGAWWTARRRAWPLLLYPAWAIVALVVLWAHAPVWYHHQLLVTVPLAPLAGLGAWAAWTAGGRTAWRRGAIGAGIVIAGAAPLVGWVADPFVPRADGADAWAAVERLRLRRDQTRVVLADMPIFAFRAGLPVPPALAVVSMKRIAGGELDADTFAVALRDEAPEQVVLTDRLPEAMRTAIVVRLGERYTLTWSGATPRPVALYVRTDLLAPGAR